MTHRNARFDKRYLSLSRRRMLEALGLGAAASPLLPLLSAFGQEMGPAPKRLLLVFSPDGIAARDWNTAVDWKPQGTETDFEFHYIHQPLTPMKHKIVIPWGLTLSAAGAGEAHAHGMAGLWTGSRLNGPSNGVSFDGGNGALTGWGSGPSVDQLIARGAGGSLPYAVAPNSPTQETPYRTVELAVDPGNPTSLNRMIYSDPDAPIHPESNPKAAFDRLFAGVSTSPTPEMDPRAEQNRVEQQAIVDFLRSDLGRIRPKVGAEDYHKLDAHLEGLAVLEQRLNSLGNGPVSPSCSLPSEPPSAGGIAFNQLVPPMMDVVAHALACDVTRVASLQLSYGFSYVTHTWLGHNSQHHTMSHDNSDRRQELQDIDNWYSQQFLYLLEKLDSFPEGDGTLLDNTLVVWGRELGTTAHRFERSPVVIAGGANLGIKGGRFLDFDGQKHAKLLVSIANIMGMETSSIGNIDPDSGPLAGLV
jgi:hypothetical protein